MADLVLRDQWDLVQLWRLLPTLEILIGILIIEIHKPFLGDRWLHDGAALDGLGPTVLREGTVHFLHDFLELGDEGLFGRLGWREVGVQDLGLGGSLSALAFGLLSSQLVGMDRCSKLF